MNCCVRNKRKKKIISTFFIRVYFWHKYGNIKEFLLFYTWMIVNMVDQVVDRLEKFLFYFVMMMERKHI